MSYNITSWRTKKLENLTIPVASFYKYGREDWHPERINHDDGSVDFSFGEQTLTGWVKNGLFTCIVIYFGGEGSGTAMNMILEPVLRDSEGELIASCVWGGGDSISRLIVKDGDVRWEDIEI